MFGLYLTQFQGLSRNVKLFLAGNAIQGIGLSIYGLLFNLYLRELGFGETAIGGMISTTSLGIALIAIPVALIIERFHVKHLVLTGMLLSASFYMVQVFNTSETSLFALGLLASMFQALFNISVAPFYLRNSNPFQRVHLFSLNSGLNIAAHLFGYLIGGYLPKILHSFNTSWSLLERYRFSMAIAIGVIFFSNLFFMNIKRVPIPRLKRGFLENLRNKDWTILSKLILPKLGFAFGGGLIIPFMNLYLKEKFVLSTETVGIAYAALQLFIFVGIFITPTLARKTTHLKFITLTAALSIPFMLAMGITAHIGLVLSCFFMRGMLMNMSSPITSIFEMEHVREQECVFTSALILFSYHLVYTASTRLGGHLIESYSFTPTFYIAAGFYALAIVGYLAFFKKEKRKEYVHVQIENKAA